MATQRVLLGNIRGPKGETGATGPTGPAGTISVGTVTKGEYGTPPQVTNSGSSTAATFDFVIPEGAPGDTVAAIDNLTLDEPTTSTATLPIPAAGERGKVIFGKIIKFCNDIKNLASTSANGLLRALSGNTSQWLRGDGSWQTAQNNLTTTSAGYVLDARQGKTLNDKVTTLNDKVTTLNDSFSGALAVKNLSITQTLNVAANGTANIIFNAPTVDGYQNFLFIYGGSNSTYDFVPVVMICSPWYSNTRQVTLKNVSNAAKAGDFAFFAYSIMVKQAINGGVK